ncbi:MAG: WYL domain-containing protein [Corynebacterium sp.]|nr:WYL domain-containing protein [Corynebacterium sp.]
MKEQRLAEITRMLRANNQVTASILAEKLKVSRRTILRDLRELQSRGVPICTEPGPHGGVSIMPGWLPPTEQLTDSELVAFMLPGGTHMAAELGLARQLQSARRKMDGRLSPKQSRKVSLLQDRLLVVPHGWKEPLTTPPVLRELFLAVAANYVITVDYQALGQRSSVRTCQPLGLVLANTTWYLIARKVPHKEVRTYRVDRIKSIARTNETFTRDPTESIAEIWSAAQQEFATEGVRVTVRSKSSVVHHVQFSLNIVGARTTIEEIPGSGDYLVTGKARCLAAAAGVLSGFGEAAVVLQPPELRLRIKELAEQNLKLYGEVSDPQVRLPSRGT